MAVDPFIGEISLFAGTFAPRGWAFCNGQLLPISQNEALFSLLGTIYGGDGRTTFALPDLRGRAPIHAGQGPGLSNRQLGQNGGVESVTLTTGQMPSHTHIATSQSKLYAQSAAGDDDTISTGISLASGSSSGSEIYIETAPNTEMNASSVRTTTTNSNEGANQPLFVMQPFLTINYIIALEGIYPSRS